MLTVQNTRCSVWRSCIYAPRRRRDKDTTASTNLEFRGAWVEILGGRCGAAAENQQQQWQLPAVHDPAAPCCTAGPPSVSLSLSPGLSL